MQCCCSLISHPLRIRGFCTDKHVNYIKNLRKNFVQGPKPVPANQSIFSKLQDKIPENSGKITENFSRKKQQVNPLAYETNFKRWESRPVSATTKKAKDDLYPDIKGKKRWAHDLTPLGNFKKQAKPDFDKMKKIISKNSNSDNDNDNEGDEDEDDPFETLFQGDGDGDLEEEEEEKEMGQNATN